MEYSYQVKQALEAQDLRGFVDDRNETIGRKIRDNELKRIPFLLIVGEKEVEAGTVSVRKQGGDAVSYTHLRAHETVLDLVCRLLLEKKKKQHIANDTLLNK